MTGVFGDHIPGIPYRPIGELFTLYRDRDPAKTAIVDLDSGSAITFDELDRITAAVARLLKSRGVAKGSRVLLLSDENLEKLLLWFGIWRLGAVVCPLNIEINAKVLADLITVVNPALVLWHKELDIEALAGGCRAPRVRFGARSAAGDADPQDELFSCLSKHEAAELPERNDPEDIACIICTSGTTGRPKIVVYDHCAYWLNGLSTLEFLGLSENDRTLEYRSFGWNSAQVLSLMPFLQKGLTIHIARRFSHSRFFDWIQQYRITFAAGVPTVLNMLLNTPPPHTRPHPPLKGEGRTAEGSLGWGGGGATDDNDAAYAEPLSPPPGPFARADLPPAEPRYSEGSVTRQSDRSRQQPTSVGGGGERAKDSPTLRLMSCSTAPLTAEQWRQFEEMYGVKLLQMYGMSEAGWVCGNRTYKNRIGTVGIPALHQEFAIVDADGRPCPPGVEGEVTAGGPQTAVGYLRDDGTIEPIRPNRIKTGDLAIEGPDGFIRITGRIKDLIIRGGVNIAPAEIDEVLLKHSGILEAAAVGVPDKIYGEEVVCYVVAKPGSDLTEASVSRHCEAFLPPAKMPKQIFIVADLPKSDRGKVLRDRLREDWTTRMKVSV
jgi:acyl-CoA synthetase (AMP-forming)/AMP-acid ligase II